MQSRQGGRLGSDLRIQERQWRENGRGWASCDWPAAVPFLARLVSTVPALEQGFCLRGLVFALDCASEAIEVR